VATSFRKFLEGLRIIPKVASTASEKGDLDVTDSSGKLNYHNGSSASPVVTEDHQATLTNKTLTSPVLNTPTADTITGITGGPLLIQSASNEDLSLQAQGSGSVSLEALTVDGNTVTGGASTLTIQSDTDEDLVIQSQGTGDLALQASGSGNVTLEAVGNGSVDIQASGTGDVTLESLTINDNTITGGASTLTIQSASNEDLALQAQGSGIITLSATEATSTLSLNAQTDAATTGSNATVATPTKSYIELTNGSLASLDAIPAGSDGQVLVLSNRTGNTVVVNNETGATAANRILTGTGGAIALDNNASLTLLYNASASRWMIVGGVGGNLVVNLTAGEALSVNDAVYVSVGASDGGRTAGSVYKVDATNDARIEFIGFALDAVSGGSLVRVQVGGGIGGFSGLSVGQQVFASETVPGGVQTTSPTLAGRWIIPVGNATSASTLTVNGAGSSTAVKITSEADPFVYASVVSVSSNTTLTTGNTVVLVDSSGGAATITLPAPVSGKIVHIKKIDSSVNAVTISPPSGTIDGAASESLLTQYDSLSIVSDGTNFFLI